MAIAFVCSCGKALKAKEAFAGRKVKCPQCHNIVRIPRLDGSLTDGSDEPAVPSPARDTPPPPARRETNPSFAQEIGSSDVLPAIAPLAKPVARPAAAPLPKTPPESTDVPAHAWVDQSLMQEPTPWLPGDEERFQKGIKPAREGLGVLEIGALSLLVLLGLGTAGWFLVWNK